MEPKNILTIEALRSIMLPTISNATNIVTDAFKSKFVYTVNIHTLKYRARLSICKYFNTELAIVEEDDKLIVVLDTFNKNNHTMSPSVYWYNGTPIVLHYAVTNDMSYNSDGMAVGNVSSKDIYMSTIKSPNHIKNLKRFLHKLVKEGDKMNAVFYTGKTQLASQQNCGYPINLGRRTFDDVFMTSEQKNLLISSIDKWRDSCKWYKDNNIPYHFGIMLYGTPGTGKSSIAQAIANHLKANMTIISGDDMLKLSEFIRNGEIPRNPEYTHIILIEDCDCGISKYHDRYFIPEAKPDDMDDEKKRPSGMASLLNSLDGIGAPQNTIYVFTTNHIERLDTALIRPGRIDLKLDIGCVCRETFDQFCMKHYGTKSDEEFEICEGLTFAALQTEIMRGISLNDLIKKIRVMEEKK